MNQYIVDSRLFHSTTLNLLKIGHHRKAVCVSNSIDVDWIFRHLLNSVLGANISCEFCQAAKFHCEDYQEALVIFDSLAALMAGDYVHIPEITLMYLHSQNAQHEYWGEGLYVDQEDKQIINFLGDSQMRVYYQPDLYCAKTLFVAEEASKNAH